jgi:hypothetical protein
MRESWDDGLKNDKYIIINGTKYYVRNQYQHVDCRYCEKVFYCRLTHIIPNNSDSLSNFIAYNNYREDVNSLKCLDELLESEGRYVDLKTARRYKIKNGTEWVVQNEYQDVVCPYCKKVFYCRLTHIILNHSGSLPELEPHNNYSKDLNLLKSLQVTYADKDCKIPIKEVQKEARWFLMINDDIIGEEINLSE